MKLVQKWLKNSKNWPKIRWKSTDICWKIGPKTVGIEFNLCKGLKGSRKLVEIWLTWIWLILYQKINGWISCKIGPKVVEKFKKLTENSLKINWNLLKNRSENGGNWIQSLQGTEGKSKIGWNLADPID